MELDSKELMMKATRLVAFGMLLTGLALQVRSQQSSTTPQPAPPPLVGSLAGHPAWPSAKNTSDVDTAEHLVASLYDVISGPAGKPRDWDRFRSLFLPDGRLGIVVPEMPATKDAPARKGDAVFLTPAMYVQRDDPYYKTHGFFERSIANRVEEFGNLIHVWSTYESRHAENDSQPCEASIRSRLCMLEDAS